MLKSLAEYTRSAIHGITTILPCARHFLENLERPNYEFIMTSVEKMSHPECRNAAMFRFQIPGILEIPGILP